MGRKYKLIAALVIIIAGVGLAMNYLHSASIPVLNPKGVIAHHERQLLFFGLLLSLIVVIPVFTLTFAIVWKYREGNTKARYTPDWDRNRGLETIWWTIPTLLILILSIVTWRSSHQLDPFRPLNSANVPITIQVVALDWKWLFIYPQQNIASVNYLQFPTNTPVNFEITADAPMNSFWIPQLGGQIYAMSGMSTQLHLMASTEGKFRGSSANISGRGFADMNFIARSSSLGDFKQWVNSVKQSPASLTLDAYNNLAKPSTHNPTRYFSSKALGLYSTIVTKNDPAAGTASAMNMELEP